VVRQSLPILLRCMSQEVAVRPVGVISVGEGMAASTSDEDMDAMFQPRPHGAIAASPVVKTHISASARSTLCSRHAELLELTHIARGLGQQPIAKDYDFWEGCCGLRANDPVRLGQTQLLRKRPQ